jgi:hypothetical protein
VKEAENKRLLNMAAVAAAGRYRMIYETVGV